LGARLIKVITTVFEGKEVLKRRPSRSAQEAHHVPENPAMKLIRSKAGKAIVGATALLFAVQQPAYACTGITLTARDGAVVYGRTVEWGAFDLHSRLIIIPRGIEMSSSTPDGKPGVKWTTKYGVAGIDAVNKDVVVDGMNERGLAVGVFYLPGFTKYQEYLPARAAESLGPLEVAAFVLTQSATVDEARAALGKVRVVPVVEPALGFPAPVHFMVTEPSGRSIVIEYLNGSMTVFDNPLGVITNAPSYDWHMTNLRNYINLSPIALPGVKVENLDFKPLGAGSGMIGLPGDFTPPSRFVRAVAFAKTARPTADAEETLYEVFRILDSFNLPLGAAEGSDAGSASKTAGMRSSTIWTVAQDTENRVLYYHTQHNRRVRSVDLKAIDFSGSKRILHAPLDKEKRQDIEDATPRR
jgi:choloylglycine hydrolase